VKFTWCYCTVCKITCNTKRCPFLSGTGSGIGTYILSLLKDEFPEIYRLAVTCEKYSMVLSECCVLQLSIVTWTRRQFKNLWRPLLPHGYSYKASCARPGRAVICNFWHLGTLTLRVERQSARMSKITNDGLIGSGTGCFIAAPMWQQWASKGWWLPVEPRLAGASLIVNVDCQSVLLLAAAKDSLTLYTSSH